MFNDIIYTRTNVVKLIKNGYKRDVIVKTCIITQAEFGNYRNMKSKKIKVIVQLRLIWTHPKHDKNIFLLFYIVCVCFMNLEPKYVCYIFQTKALNWIIAARGRLLMSIQTALLLTWSKIISLYPSHILMNTGDLGAIKFYTEDVILCFYF